MQFHRMTRPLSCQIGPPWLLTRTRALFRVWLAGSQASKPFPMIFEHGHNCFLHAKNSNAMRECYLNSRSASLLGSFTCNRGDSRMAFPKLTALTAL